MSTVEHSISVARADNSYFWRCTCGRDGISVASVHIAERYGSQHVVLKLRAEESEYLHGLDLDAVLSDWTPDIVEPVDREGQVIDLPSLTQEQRCAVMLEYHQDIVAVSL